MLIRKMIPKDNLEIKNIIQDSLKSFQLDIPGTAYFDPQLNDLFHYYNNIPKAQYWVVEDQGRIVGGIGIAPFDMKQNICELQKLYLLPEVQGLGISKRLMETALEFASHFYTSCYLETTQKLTAACHLYEKYGFKPLENPLENSPHSAMDRWYLKKLTMKKPANS